MSQRRYTTEFVITGDSSSGVKASRDLQRANADLTQEMQRAERQSQQMSQSFESVSVHAQRLATVSAATTAAMGAMAISQTRNIAEQAALARSVGVTVQTLQQWEFAAQSVNLGAGKMGDIFKDTSEKIGDFVATGGGEAADLFERLNLNINELMGMSPDQQLLAIGEALDDVATQGEKIFFMESLANDASRLLPLLEDNGALLREQIGLADQFGVAMSQSDIDSIEQANKALNELMALGTGFANEVAAQWAPGIVAFSGAVKTAVDELGGMGEVVEFVSDTTVLLTGVLAGRLVGSLVEAGQATINKVKADRAAALQSAATARQETATALAVARRAEAEQVAAISSAQATAQRTQAAQAEAAAKLRFVQTNQQLMASERALETQRLQAQISATGRQQSLARLADIRRTEMDLIAQVTAANNALKVAEQETAKSAQAVAAAKTAAGRAATATNAAYTANTAAANTAATANTVLAGAATAASRAMRLVGGPVGVATLAASAFFLFRDSSDEVNASLVNLDDPLESTIESFREMNSEAQQAAVIRWGDRAEEEAEKASSALGSIRQEIASLSGARLFGGRDEEQYEGYRRLLTEINAVGEGAQNLTEVLSEAQQYMEIPDDVLRKLRLLAAEYAEHDENSQQAAETLDTLVDALNDVANSADNAGDSVNSSAPTNETLEAWGKYNDRLRESIAAAHDGGSAVGAANRAMDGMGEGVNDVMRGYTIFLTAQDEALKQQKKAQEEAATAAKQATTEAERNAQRQAQAAEQAAEAQAAALIGIQQEMEPLLADHATYIERLGVLDQALADGSITQEQYGELLRWSAEQYTRAATGAEDYEKQTESLISTYDSHNQKAEQLRDALEQINQRYRAGEIDGDQYARMVGGVRDEMQQLAIEADPISKELARLWEEAANRINETFGDAFTGAFDSFDDFSDQLLDGFKRLMGELAYQATLKPIVVAFTGDMQGMMGIGGGSSGGGFGSTIGAAKNLFSKGSSLFGGGSAASAGGLYGNIATNAAASSGGLYANAATGSAIGTGAAGGGFLSSAASMAGPIAAMYAAAEMGNKLFESIGAYDALGIRTDGRSSEFLGQIAPIGGTLIGSALDALGIGGQKTKFSGRFGTTAGAGSGTFEHQDTGRFYGQSALGYTGFINKGTERLQRAGTGSKDWAEELTNASVEMDNLVASLASSPVELRAMQSAVQGLETSSSSAADIIDFALKVRPRAAIEAMTGDFGQFVQSLSGGIESVVQQAQAAQQSYSAVTAGLESINVEFGVTGPAAYSAAAEIAELSGGLEQFGAQAQYYYENFVSEADKQEKAMDAAARSMGVFTANTGRVVTSTDQLTDLVEGLNLNTTAGRELYAAAMELAPALVEVEAGLERVRDRFGEMLNTAEGAAETAAQQARSAWGTFDSQSYDQQRQLLALLGDSEAALALERERELATLDEALRPHQERIWALEDEATAVNNYASALESANTFLAGALDNIADWIDQRRATGGLPSENLQESQAQFARQLELAESGDRDALQSITEYADRYLSAASGYYASGDGFQSVESDVMDALAALPDALSPEDYIAQDIKDALENSENLSSLPEMKELAGEQLGALHSLIDEMRNSTDQFVSLDSNMISLRDSINALGVAREEVARIERERAAAEKAARERIERERKAAAEVERYEQERQSLIDQQAKLSGLIDSIENSPSLASWERQVDQLNSSNGTRTAVDSAFEKAASVLDLSAPLNEFNDQLSGIIANFRQDGSLYSAAAWEPVARILRAQSQIDNREDALAEIERQLAALRKPKAFATGGVFTNSVVSSPTLFDMGLMGEAGPEAIVPLHMGSDGLGIKSYARELPMPDMPMPQFPQLGNADVLQALKDLGNENKQLRADINRLLGDVKTNTGNTANAVASSAGRAEQQRTAQLEEQRAATRAARLKGRTA